MRPVDKLIVDKFFIFRENKETKKTELFFFKNEDYKYLIPTYKRDCLEIPLNPIDATYKNYITFYAKYMKGNIFLGHLGTYINFNDDEISNHGKFIEYSSNWILVKYNGLFGKYHDTGDVSLDGVDVDILSSLSRGNNLFGF